MEEQVFLMTEIPANSYDVYTTNGSFRVIESITLGEMAVALSILLLLSFLVLKWLLETVWKGGRR